VLEWLRNYHRAEHPADSDILEGITRLRGREQVRETDREEEGSGREEEMKQYIERGVTR